jgi:REP element-mobilizing transposase RayT
MGRRIEQDYPGAWWHVTNRGISKRTVFESSTDTTLLDELIGRATERGLLEVHAYVYMPDHFHLLVRSPVGRLSYAIGLTENSYVRIFNRTRRRDGSLFRGRFWRRRIDDWLYWETVLRYIDQNPVRAGICSHPAEYRHGSAAAYAGGPCPEWLVKAEVERTVRAWSRCDDYDPTVYEEFSSSVDHDVLAHLVEGNLRRKPGAIGLAELYRAASHDQRCWMEWKARLADSTRLRTVILTPAVVRAVLSSVRKWVARRPSAGRIGHDLDAIEAGLLRFSCGLSLREVASVMSTSPATAQRLAVESGARQTREPVFDRLQARLSAVAFRRQFNYLRTQRHDSHPIESAIGPKPSDPPSPPAAAIACHPHR